MNKRGHTARHRRVVDYAAAALEQMRDYCAARPSSPPAVRHPQLFFRGDRWIAVLGPNLKKGIVGIMTHRSRLRFACSTRNTWLDLTRESVLR
jgi:hypothetical protein